MPDAAAWGDAGSDTLGHICEHRAVNLPNLQRWGLGNIRPLAACRPPKIRAPRSDAAPYARTARTRSLPATGSNGWHHSQQAFPTYPQGFPPEIVQRFIKETGVPGILGNVPASGTEIIKELGEEHVRTGKPIVYTSADSVFQIAAHEEVFPVPRLYEIGETARNILRGEQRWGASSRDLSSANPARSRAPRIATTTPCRRWRENLLPLLSANGLDVVSVGRSLPSTT